MEIDPEYIHLLHKELTRQLSPEEASRLKVWTDENEKHRQFREEIRLSWELAGTSLPEVEEDEIEEEFSRLQQRLYYSPDQNTIATPDRRRMVYMMMGIILLLIIGAGSFILLRSTDAPRATTVYYANTAAGEDRREVLLPDSSKVFLRDATKLSFQLTREHREVNLSGQAFFQVAPDEQLPFIIYIEGMTVKVLGTSFFVKAQAGQPLEVGVSSGRVEVVHREQRFQLTKGELLLIEQDREPYLGMNTDPNYLSWKDGKLLFRQTPMKEVLQALERHYGVTFDVATPQVLSCRFTGTFENVAMEELLEIISYSLGVSIEKVEERRFRLSGEGCQSEEP